MKKVLIKSAFVFWKRSWIKRAQELLFFYKNYQVWRAGYGRFAPSFLAYMFEGFVRILELTGLGFLFFATHVVFSGNRFRPLSLEEKEILSLYFYKQEIQGVFLDEGSVRTAKRLRIAFVFGFLIKSYKRLPAYILVHEMVHIRQFHRWGWAYIAKALWAQFFGEGYTLPVQWQSSQFLKNQSLRHSFHPALNAEQEARKVEQSFRLRG